MSTIIRGFNNWVSRNASILTIILVAINIALFWVAFKSITLNRKMIELQSRPWLDVEIDTFARWQGPRNKPIINGWGQIRNIGQGAARYCKFTIILDTLLDSAHKGFLDKLYKEEGIRNLPQFTTDTRPFEYVFTEKYPSILREDSDSLYLHVCCEFKGTGTEIKYYFEQVFFVKFSSDGNCTIIPKKNYFYPNGQNNSESINTAVPILKGSSMLLPSIIAVCIAVIGWIINHIFTIRAQRRNFKDQLYNNARLQIADAITNYREWLTKIWDTIGELEIKVLRQELGSSLDWVKEKDEVHRLFYPFGRTRVEWLSLLEEYEILFPEIAKCKKDLADRNIEIMKFLYEFTEHFQDLNTLKERKGIVEKANKNIVIIQAQISLMSDLLIYLQNRCLSSFTGNKIPEKGPKDLSMPRLILDEKGVLQIVKKDKTNP